MSGGGSGVCQICVCVIRKVRVGGGGGAAVREMKKGGISCEGKRERERLCHTVAPPHQQIPYIHHARPLHRRHVHEPALPPPVLDLQTPALVLEQDCHAAPVRVRGHPGGFTAFERFGGDGRVVQEAELVVVAAVEVE